MLCACKEGISLCQHTCLYVLPDRIFTAHKCMNEILDRTVCPHVATTGDVFILEADYARVDANYPE